MATSTAPEVMKALRDKLREREGLAEVMVATGPLVDSRPLEAIELLGVQGIQDWAQWGGTPPPSGRDEDYTIPALITAAKEGAGEEVIEAVRERAYEILAEVDDELRENPKLDELPNLLWLRLGDINLSQGASDNLRHAAISFSIQVRGRI